MSTLSLSIDRTDPVPIMTSIALPISPRSFRSSVTLEQDCLTPVGGNEACGPSLEYDAEYAVLLARLTPRGDAQYGKFVDASEGPNWSEIERDCRRLLLRTKDIHLFVWLCRARTRLGQASGLAQALTMLAQALRRWPATIHPQPIVEGQSEPGVRANALAALADPEGLLGDVRDIAVVPRAASGLTVRDVERALALPRRADALDPQSVTRQLAELRSKAANDDSAVVTLLGQAAHQLRFIDTWCQDNLADHSPSLHGLRVLLEPFEFQDGTEGSSPPFAPRVQYERPPNARARDEVPSSACERDGALQEIRSARQWFEDNEPSSPVAVLLKQAERMVGKRFSEIADAIPLDLLRQWEIEQESARPGGGA